MKLKKAFTASVIFLSLLTIFYFIHVKYFQVNVVFYSAILDAILAALFATGLLFRLSYFNIFSIFEKFQMAAIWILIGYAFAISVPTVIDRSLSFYILEKLQQRGGGIEYSRFEDVFTKEYLYEHRLVDVRLTEQMASGTITVKDGCVKLTKHGERLAGFSRFFRQNFLPKERLLMGEYSDALTDPFRDSIHRMGYEC